jgi:hypothetical protein
MYARHRVQAEVKRKVARQSLSFVESGSIAIESPLGQGLRHERFSDRQKAGKCRGFRAGALFGACSGTCSTPTKPALDAGDSESSP